MQAVFGALLLLVALATVKASPAFSRSFGRYVSECDTGDTCLSLAGLADNVTATSVDGTLFCCAAGNSITLSVRRNTSGVYQSQSRGFLTSGSLDNVIFSSDVTLFNDDGSNDDDDSSSSNNSSDSSSDFNQVVCECRDVDLEEVAGYLKDVRQSLWDTFDSTWNRISGYFR
ncbi:hypothetical protein EGW08_011450 [Elysia chlorotica]|uniref:Uncharacterized protein n=1 Tax=Elysia chlorotica TaxID=188477 RepID=A0A3S1B655_ELYCH|nr:hypothetical protein EGW08_011450 [Elysia chlorotica]